MKLRLDATPDELVEKSDQLVETLSGLLRSAAPELAENLEKALPAKEQELKYPVLRELFKRTEKLYEQHIQKMLKDIGDVLGGAGIQKSSGGSTQYDHTKAPAIKDNRAYMRVKQVLVRLGYLESDFDEGGALYGWSTNQLIDLAQEKRDG